MAATSHTPRLAEEIDSWKADVFCLQEVDQWASVMQRLRSPVHCTWARKGDAAGAFTTCITSARHAHLQPPAAAAGSQSESDAAAGDSDTPACTPASPHDGCLCAWNPAKFDYVRHHVIALPSPSSKPGVALLTLLTPKTPSKILSHETLEPTSEFPPLGAGGSNRAARRHAAATQAAASAAAAAAAAASTAAHGHPPAHRQALASPHAEADRATQPQHTPLLVVTTHIVWNSKRGDVKLQQLYLIFQAIEAVRAACSHSLSPAIIFCGDFNSTPSSAIYSLITTGKLFFGGGVSNAMLSGQQQVLHHDSRTSAPPPPPLTCSFSG
jgi:endonuclease/exonuclease/phosphatase family metal-dependent hydrolase